jgi:HSP20 family molecular chaperone IbpA
MKKALRIMLPLVALILVAGFLFNCAQPESSARHKLDNLLGEPSEHMPPPAASEEAPASPDWFNKPNFLGFTMPEAVNVQETGSAYVLRVPIANPGDADQVQVNVSSSRIEVSGQTGSKHGNSSSSSSFFQSFTTSQAVLPNKMTKKVEKKGEQNQLVITIPKDPQAPHAAKALPATPLPDLQSPQEDLESTPLDDEPHKVI